MINEIAEIKTLEKEGKFSEALLKAEDYLAKYSNESPYAGYFLLRMGSALCRAKKCKIGLKYFKKAYQHGIQYKDTILLGKSLLGLGAGHQFLHTSNSNDSAYYFYELAHPLLHFKNDSLELIGIQSNISMMSDSFEDKERNYLLLINIRDNLEDFRGVCETYYNLGMLYYNNGVHSKAYDSFYQSYKLAKSQGFRNDLIKSERGLAISSFFMGEKDKAFEFFLAYDSAASKWLYSEDYNNKLLEWETKFKTSEVEKENIIQQGQLEEARIHRVWLFVAVVMVLMLSVTGYLFLDQRRKRLKVNAIVNEEKASQKIHDLLQEQEMKTAYALLDGQDSERKRIAAELHDSLGNIMATLNMYAHALSLNTAGEKVEINAMATKIGEMSKNAGEEVRKISHRLDAGLLKHFGLETALSQLMEAIESTNQIQVTMTLQFDNVFTNELGLQIYRIIQELVTNALRHAACTQIHLEMEQINEDISIIFEDNGRGFDPKDLKMGIGLNNIQHRVDRLGGEFKIDSSLAKGSAFILEIPIHHE